MWVGVDRLGAMMLDASLSATVLSSLVVLAMLGCRQPARRLRLSRAAVLGLLALIPLTWLAPLPRLDLIGAARDSGLLIHPLLSAHEPTSLSPGPEAPVASRMPWQPPGRGVLAVTGPWPARALVLLYLAGLGIGLAWLVLGYWGLHWLTRSSSAPSAPVLALYESLPLAGRHRRPRLRVTDRVRRPVLIGLARPTILVPAGLDRPDASVSLRLSLLHELAHAEGADPWFCLVGSLAQAFWFFLPPLWWIRNQMRLDHEFLADRRAARGFGPLQSYASSLLELATPSSGMTSCATAPPKVPERMGSALFQRVLMLVQCPFPVEPHPPGWWSWSLPSLILVGTVAASSISLRTAEDPPSPPRPAPGALSKTFRVARLVVDPGTGGPQGSTPIFELPLRLPEHFDLSGDVWGDRATLAQCRMVGFRLRLPGPPSCDAAEILENWHRVRVRRDAHGVSLWIDGRPVPLDPDSGTATTWLSVTPPPDAPGQFQNLTLTW